MAYLSQRSAAPELKFRRRWLRGGWKVYVPGTDFKAEISDYSYILYQYPFKLTVNVWIDQTDISFVYIKNEHVRHYLVKGGIIYKNVKLNNGKLYNADTANA